MLMMSVSGVGKTYYEQCVLDSVSLEVMKGDRIGLLGANGSGKTTLMEMMAGFRQADRGVISWSKGTRVGYLPQMPVAQPGLTAGAVAMQGLKNLGELREKLAELEQRMADAAGSSTCDERLLATYGRVQSQFEHLGGYEMDERVARIREALKIDDHLWERVYDHLSGGEKTRIALAALLMEGPDLLLLDEPTNHLDVEMIEWLESFLNSYEGAVVLISHDRYFLDNVVDRICEICAGRLEVYEGNYSMYTVEKQSRYELQLKNYNNQQKKLRAMEAAIKRFQEWGRIGGDERMFVKANQMRRRMEKIDKIERPSDSKPRFAFEFAEQDKSSRKVVMGKSMKKAYGSQVILNQQDFEIERGERVALIGHNGSGKTTLFKILMGLTELDGGSLELGSGIAPIWLEQEVAFPNPKQAIVDYYKEEAMVEEGRARHILAGFGFRGAEVFRSVGSLSGGERSRLRLLVLTGTQANLLMLDEPTNHLDIATKELLEENMGDFGGTVFFISHDRYFINMVADRIVELEGGVLRSYLGSYDDYKEKKQTMAAQGISMENANKEMKAKPGSSGERSSGYTQIKTQSGSRDTAPAKPLNRYALEKIEQQIEVLENEKSRLNETVALCASDYEKLTEAMAALEATEIELEALMTKWEAMQRDS